MAQPPRICLRWWLQGNVVSIPLFEALGQDVVHDYKWMGLGKRL